MAQRWLIVLCGFFIMFAGFTIINSLHSLFMLPVTSELGFSRTTFSVILSIGGFGVALASPFMGKLLTRGNMKLIMSSCVILAGLGFMSYSLADSAIHFGIVAFLIGICIAGFSNIPISIMLTNWFHEKKGMAMGIAFAGSGIGAAVLSPILSSLILNYGWRTTYIIAGMLIIVITLPLILLFAKKTPGEQGLKASGTEKRMSEGQEASQTGITLAEAKKTGRFWLFVFGVICFSLVAGGVQMHIPAYLVDIGHPALFAGTIFGLLSLSNTLGKLILGVVFDRFRTAGGAIYVGVCMTIAIVSLLMAKAETLAFVFAVAYGFSVVISTVGVPFMTDDLFGKKDFGALFGYIQVFFTIAGSLGVIVSGFIYDVTQSYQMAWIFFLGLFIISMLSILIADYLNKKSLNGLDPLVGEKIEEIR